MTERNCGYCGKVIPRYDVKDCSYKSPWEPILDAKFKGVGERFKMNKMIGKISNKDWSLAKDDATHVTKFGVFYKYEANKCYVYGTSGEYWSESENGSRWLEDNLISKEEDLEMGKKEDKTVKDLGVGVFVRWHYSADPYVFLDKDTLLSFSTGDKFLRDVGFTDKSLTEASWSYTFDGEYTPIVKETEADIKIKELEATIALAQKQLQEYKGMK